MEPFIKFDIYPSYAVGFTYMWDVSAGFGDPLPWNFYIERALGLKEGPPPEWETIDGPFTNSFVWVEDKRRVVGKDLIFMFRVRLETPNGVYYSAERAPYFDFQSRRDYLLCKEIMRKEVLQARKLGGILGAVWIKSMFGEPAEGTVDPITGDPLTDDGPDLGTGFAIPYHGPYNVWLTFEPLKRGLQMKQDGSGTFDPVAINVRLIGFPYTKTDDILIDPKSDKRYTVKGVRHIMEIRRVPVVQELACNELPTSDPAYKLDTPAMDEEGCTFE